MKTARSTRRDGFKVLTHDLKPPVQGGKPIFDGRLPCTLPCVMLDVSSRECAEGWNYTADLHTALTVGGLWPDGRPSRAFVVCAPEDAIVRGSKRRASVLTLVREVSEEEIGLAIDDHSAAFGVHATRMAAEQHAWRRALARPRRDVEAVKRGLRTALAARALDWRLCQCDTAEAAWAAWAVRDARATEAAWATWDARAAEVTWNTRATEAAEVVRDAWGTKGARGTAVRGAWDAKDALTVCYAALNGWIVSPPEFLTSGLREAYESGLEVAIPAASGVLEFAMSTP